MQTELKPCPFCGGEAKTHGPYGWDGKWCISHNCPALYNGGSEAFKGYLSEKEAIAAWNTRTTPDPLSDPRVIALVEAARAMRDHLDRWQETGAVATAQESKALYDGIDAALRAIGEGGE